MFHFWGPREGSQDWTRLGGTISLTSGHACHLGNENKRSQGKEPRPIFEKEHHETGLEERGNVGFNQGNRRDTQGKAERALDGGCKAGPSEGFGVKEGTESLRHGKGPT